MSGSNSGFMSNAYAYDPLKVQDGMWKQALGNVGGAIGGAIMETSPVILSVAGPGGTAVGAAASAVGVTIGSTVGTAVGEQIGILLDNSDTVTANVQNFLTEVNDWRSWEGMMKNYSGWSY